MIIELAKYFTDGDVDVKHACFVELSALKLNFGHFPLKRGK